MANFATNLRGSSPRAKLFLACIVLDIGLYKAIGHRGGHHLKLPFSTVTAFLALMATASAGPLSNQSIYWTKYNNGTILGVRTSVSTGIWGNCRDPTPGLGFCIRWTDDPYFGVSLRVGRSAAVTF